MALLSSDGFKHKGMLAIGALVLSLLVVSAVWGNRGLLHLWLLDDQLQQLEATAIRLQQENDHLRDHLRRLRSEPSYQERVVRARLGWVRRGEILYRVPRTTGKGR